MYDRQLVWIALALMVTGLVMVTSASVPVATRLTDMPFYFALRHGFFSGLLAGDSRFHGANSA
jgi:cell division protein FtsW